MKKYFIAVAAMAFLAACSGKQAQKDVPVRSRGRRIRHNVGGSGRSVFATDPFC